MTNLLLTDIKDFLAENPEIAASTFGRKAANDGKLVARLESGGQVLPTTKEKIEGYIQSYRAKKGAKAC